MNSAYKDYLMQIFACQHGLLKNIAVHYKNENWFRNR
jgi:hypothetical protein